MTAIGPYSMATVREPDVNPVYIGKLTNCNSVLQALKRYTPYYYDRVIKTNLLNLYEKGCTVFAFEHDSKCQSIGECVSFCKNTVCKGVIKPDALTSSQYMVIPTVNSSNLIIETFDSGNIFVNKSIVEFSIECSDGMIYVIYDRLLD